MEHIVQFGIGIDDKGGETTNRLDNKIDKLLNLKSLIIKDED